VGSLLNSRLVRRMPLARLVGQAQDWPWSSVRSHLSGSDDGITTLSPVLNRFPRFAEFIATDADPDTLSRLRRAERVGRPLGSDAFVENLEDVAKRKLKPRKRGPKPGDEPDPRQAELSALSP